MLFKKLKISAEGVKGKGTDDVGKFKLRGTVNGTTVTFTKQYIGKHSVEYKGEKSGSAEVSGQWKLEGGQTGGFKLV